MSAAQPRDHPRSLQRSRKNPPDPTGGSLGCNSFIGRWVLCPAGNVPAATRFQLNSQPSSQLRKCCALQCLGAANFLLDLRERSLPPPILGRNQGEGPRPAPDNLLSLIPEPKGLVSLDLSQGDEGLFGLSRLRASLPGPVILVFSWSGTGPQGWPQTCWNACPLVRGPGRRRINSSHTQVSFWGHFDITQLRQAGLTLESEE